VHCGGFELKDYDQEDLVRRSGWWPWGQTPSSLLAVNARALDKTGTPSTGLSALYVLPTLRHLCFQGLHL
jgi:hypothetical protein